MYFCSFGKRLSLPLNDRSPHQCLMPCLDWVLDGPCMESLRNHNTTCIDILTKQSKHDKTPVFSKVMWPLLWQSMVSVSISTDFSRTSDCTSAERWGHDSTIRWSQRTSLHKPNKSNEAMNIMNNATHGNTSKKSNTWSSWIFYFPWIAT